MTNDFITVEINGKKYKSLYDFGPGPDGIPIFYFNCGYCIKKFKRKNGWLTNRSRKCRVCGAKVVRNETH